MGIYFKWWSDRQPSGFLPLFVPHLLYLIKLDVLHSQMQVYGHVSRSISYRTDSGEPVTKLVPISKVSAWA